MLTAYIIGACLYGAAYCAVWFAVRDDEPFAWWKAGVSAVAIALWPATLLVQLVGFGWFCYVMRRWNP